MEKMLMISCLQLLKIGFSLLFEIIIICFNRETIIFDPTREVPEAIKVLDQKKKDAMKKYEVRYKVENQMRVTYFMRIVRVNLMKRKEILHSRIEQKK